MSLSNHDLDKINGPGAADELAAARARNAEVAASTDAEQLAKRLGDIATPAGVVDQNASLALHSGEVPVVSVEPQE